MARKGGKRRRYEQARALKQGSPLATDDGDGELAEPCAECGAQPGDGHASWCLADQDDDFDDDED